MENMRGIIRRKLAVTAVAVLAVVAGWGVSPAHADVFPKLDWTCRVKPDVGRDNIGTELAAESALRAVDIVKDYLR